MEGLPYESNRDFTGHQVPGVMVWSLPIVLLKYLHILGLFKLLINLRADSLHWASQSVQNGTNVPNGILLWVPCAPLRSHGAQSRLKHRHAMRARAFFRNVFGRELLAHV